MSSVDSSYSLIPISKITSVNSDNILLIPQRTVTNVDSYSTLISLSATTSVVSDNSLMLLRKITSIDSYNSLADFI